jgi:hypothetical protein
MIYNMKKNNYKSGNSYNLAIIAIVAALGLFGVVVVTIVTIPLQQEAEARGCINPNAPAGGGVAANASKGRCVK